MRLPGDKRSRLRGHKRIRANVPMRPREHRHVYTSLPLTLALPPYPLAHPVQTSWCVRTDAARTLEKKILKKLFFIYFYFGSCLLEKRGKKSSVFNLQDPQDPRAPRAKPREEEGFFGLVPLVTHPSSIPLLGGLTPKFLSLSFHSLQGLLMLMASRVGTLWGLGNLIDLELNLWSIESNEGVTTNIIIIAP
jgi:hypothetical protein